VKLRVFRAAAALLLVAACASTPASSWAEVALPGAAPRIVRDAIECGGRWYVVGGWKGTDGETGPAAWDSIDGVTWRSLTFSPLPDSFYGPSNVLSAVACANGKIAAIGARSGGAHGNPRVSTWYERSDGVLAEAPATFETYGGGTAVALGRISGGPSGFLIAGNRTSGAAAWLSADGKAFQLFENAPGLAGPGTVAQDGAVMARQFVLVGGVAVTGSLDQAPAAWTSPDGARWTRAEVPGEAGYEELQRVVQLGADLIAVGPRGDTFGAWRGPAWTAVGRFGKTTKTGIRSLTVAGSRLYAATPDALWYSDDAGKSWHSSTPPAGATQLEAVAGRGDQVLVVAADRLWLSHGV